MTARVTSWFSWRRGKTPIEKRKKIDPRYRDPNYPDFVCRRKKPHDFKIMPEGKLGRFFRGHPERKALLIAGIAALLIVFALLFFCVFSLSNTDPTDLHLIKKSPNPIFGLK
ncbi:MAG: hypothetical protein JRI34_09955 [Deltaproteobacteria bacterium]|nr:hypothetical protein [Deltaproteobacteria bacterium]